MTPASRELGPAGVTGPAGGAAGAGAGAAAAGFAAAVVSFAAGAFDAGFAAVAAAGVVVAAAVPPAGDGTAAGRVPEPSAHTASGSRQVAPPPRSAANGTRGSGSPGCVSPSLPRTRTEENGAGRAAAPRPRGSQLTIRSSPGGTPAGGPRAGGGRPRPDRE